MYWLVNTGTTEDPWTEHILERYREWNTRNGDVQMFPARPARMTGGDVLIHRLVGSAECELVAVGEVIAPARPSGDERWPWQVDRRLLYVCDSPADAPPAARAGIAARGLRVFKELTEEQGRAAVALIAAAGRPYPPSGG